MTTNLLMTNVTTSATPSMHGTCIAFEGVDGAGKSTVLALVAQKLREHGHEVYLPRDGKEPQSAAARAIRTLSRDPSLVGLSPLTEFHLFCARESQMFEQSVRPALARGAIVLLDRTLLTAEVIATHTRGVEPHWIAASAAEHPIHRVVSQTFVFDVHPKTSRIRKRIGEAMLEPNDDFGRKGLSGSKFKYDLRAGYQEYARARNLQQVSAERRRPEEIASEVVARILQPGSADIIDDSQPRWIVDAELDFASAVSQLPQLEAIYFERGLRCGRARRRELATQLPNFVAWAMDSQDPLRDELALAAPMRCIGGLSSTPLASTKDLRWRHREVEPEACAAGLRWVDGELADALRIALFKEVPHQVLRSLCGRADPLADELRRTLWKKAPTLARAESLQGLAQDQWSIERERLFDVHPAHALLSLRRCPAGAFDKKLEDYADTAPKLVLAALTGRTDDLARSLRRQLMAHAREVLDAIADLFDAPEMQIRHDLAQQWPAEVARSLAGAPESRQTNALLTNCNTYGSGDLHMLRQTAFLAQRRSDALENMEHQRNG